MPGPDPANPPQPIVRPEPTDGGASETEGWWPAGAQRPEQEPFNSPRRWANRLAFPLMIFAVLMAWHGLQVAGGRESSLAPWAWWTLAGLSGIAGLLMLLSRHRASDGKPPAAFG